MGDKLRLMLTGVAAAGAIGATVAGANIWTLLDHEEDQARRTAPVSQLRDFNGISLRGPDNVIVTKGDDFSVRPEGDPEALRHVSLSVKDGVLQVTREGSRGWLRAGGRPVTVHVTMPELARVQLVGSGNIQADGIGTKEFHVRLDGSGGVEARALATETVDLTLNGSGHMKLGGAAQRISANLQGSGHIDANDLKALTATVSVTGSGQVAAHAVREAALTLTGSGNAQVAGTSQCQIRKTGSGEAECSP